MKTTGRAFDSAGCGSNNWWGNIRVHSLTPRLRGELLSHQDGLDPIFQAPDAPTDPCLDCAQWLLQPRRYFGLGKTAEVGQLKNLLLFGI
jgi:hypothetical protein